MMYSFEPVELIFLLPLGKQTTCVSCSSFEGHQILVVAVEHRSNGQHSVGYFMDLLSRLCVRPLAHNRYAN